MSNQKTNKIIVIGGGYGGLRTVEKLAKNPNNEITLFDKNPYHFMQTDVYDLIANEEDFAQVTVDLFTYCMGFDSNVVFYKQEVTNIDFKNKKIITQIQRYTYDYLVIAVGSRTKFMPSIPGLREYAYGIKALHRAMYFKQKFEMSLFNKVDESGTVCTPINIIIAGAGLSGVEIAAQMASFSREFYRRNNFICRKLNIVLINSGKTILKGMDKHLVKKSQERLLDLEIVIKHERKVVQLSSNSVKLSGGEELHMDFMIFAGGVEPNGLVYDLNLVKNEDGYIVTNDSFQVPQYNEVFAIGDCTTIYNNGERVSPTADVAEQMADICAKNIRNLILDKHLLKHNIKSRGTLIALGRGYAVSKLFGLYFNGYIAHIVKKIVEKVYAKRLDYRSNRGCKKIFNC
ncbi:NADH dehydrogenase [Sulfurimonas gotlandica GD1]|uniref:NADH dehydrogenase n=1 Tax=Sulfurimonas gotlandica (strain DSM 19862 / JCM 16533 / GD1) TaxID=929558 RepID=B6BI89_SULGG|nr:FAD-dependent oxidoreductase [Sulfurimonas gotlandica]EDZ63069.1 FAD-dependent pyridine nucleotide-disulphide oxidoreductase [Sulfurimonas gotlandica GD1]EHP30239.1 NADH dehydrogenase [Sulfurimonas gotlandica GD1]